MANRVHAKAYEVVDHVEKHYLLPGKNFSYGFIVEPEQAEAIRSVIYKELKRRGQGGKVTVTHTGDSLWVGTRQSRSRETRLANMVRKLMAHCDNENVYDEAYALLHGGTNG